MSVVDEWSFFFTISCFSFLICSAESDVLVGVAGFSRINAKQHYSWSVFISAVIGIERPYIRSHKAK